MDPSKAFCIADSRVAAVLAITASFSMSLLLAVVALRVEQSSLGLNGSSVRGAGLDQAVNMLSACVPEDCPAQNYLVIWGSPCNTTSNLDQCSFWHFCDGSYEKAPLCIW